MRQSLDHARTRIVLAGCAAALLAGCAAQRPVLYPNAQLEQVGRPAADSEVDVCMGLANEAGASNDPTGRIAKDTAKTAAVGGATGAVVGAIAGSAGRGAAIGAAGGATATLVNGLFESGEPDPIYRNFVNTCLAERGYRVVGWR